MKYPQSSLGTGIIQHLNNKKMIQFELQIGMTFDDTNRNDVIRLSERKISNNFRFSFVNCRFFVSSHEPFQLTKRLKR